MDPKRVNNLFNLGLFNIKLGLQNIRDLLEELDNPHIHPKVIHIAGTNGKGSTLVALEKLLLDTGFSTGSTISPHLVSFNERFRINGLPVDDKALEQAYLTVCNACGIHADLSPETLEKGKVKPTFFEFSIAMAFILFQDFKVDYVLLETGLGGRLDATNVVEKPIANIITRIALDHQSILGDTIEEIAAEKLGIIKTGAVVFSALQEPIVKELIQKTCSRIGNKLFCCPDHFRIGESDSDEFAVFYIDDLMRQLPDERIISSVAVKKSGLIGEYQKENLITALATYFYLMSNQNCLGSKRIAQSFENLKWQGRLEYLEGKDDVLLDVAHNVSGMKTLLEYIQLNHSGDKILFAVGWTKHHELIPAFKQIPVKYCDFLPIQMINERSQNVDIVYNILKKNNFSLHHPISINALVDGIKNNTLPDYDLLVVAGSLYLVGEFLAGWNGTVVQA